MKCYHLSSFPLFFLSKRLGQFIVAPLVITNLIGYISYRWSPVVCCWHLKALNAYLYCGSLKDLLVTIDKASVKLAIFI